MNRAVKDYIPYNDTVKPRFIVPRQRRTVHGNFEFDKTVDLIIILDKRKLCSRQRLPNGILGRGNFGCTRPGIV